MRENCLAFPSSSSSKVGGDNVSGDDGISDGGNTNDVLIGESILELSEEGTDAIAIVTSTDFSNLNPTSFDSIEEIRFTGSNQTGTFLGEQLSDKTLLVGETTAPALIESTVVLEVFETLISLCNMI